MAVALAVIVCAFTAPHSVGCGTSVARLASSPLMLGPFKQRNPRPADSELPSTTRGFVVPSRFSWPGTQEKASDSTKIKAASEDEEELGITGLLREYGLIACESACLVTHAIWRALEKRWAMYDRRASASRVRRLSASFECIV